MRIPKGAVVFGIVLALAGASGAAEKHWDGEGYNGQWMTPANWDNNTLPDPNGDDLIFDRELLPFTYLGGNWVANSITFNTWMGFNIGYPPDPNTLTIKTGNVTRNDQAGINDGIQSIFVPVVLGADGVWTNNASHGAVKAAETISGAYGIEFRCDRVYDPNILSYTDPNDWGQQGDYTDPNQVGDPNYFVYEPSSVTILLPADPNYHNSYTGATTMTSGRVEINDMQTGSGNLTVNGGTMTVGLAARVTNAGNVVVNDGTLNIELNGKATSSGTAALKGGTLRMHDPNALGTAAYTFALGGSGAGVGEDVTLALAFDPNYGNTFTRNISVQAGNGHYIDPNQVGDPNYPISDPNYFVPGDVRIRAEEDAIVSGTIGLNRDLILDAATIGTGSGSRYKNLTISNVISDASGSNNLIKAGGGCLFLTAANTYGGTTTINGGMLALSSTGSLPATSNIILSGGVFGTRGSFDPNLGTGAGEVRWVSKTTGGFAAYVEDPNLSGDLTVDLNGGGADNLVWDLTPYFIGDAALAFGSREATNKVTLIDNIDLNNKPRIISVANNGDTPNDIAEIAGVISGCGDPNTALTSRALTKDGDGTLILSGNNTFTGNTEVKAGHLILSGSNAYTGESRIVSGSLTIASGGSIDPNSVIRLRGGVYGASGTFTRSLGDTGPDKVYWASDFDAKDDPNDPNLIKHRSGGFAAYGGNLTVDINNDGPNTLVWDSTPHFVHDGASLLLGSGIADAKVTFIDNIDLGPGGAADPNDNGTRGDPNVIRRVNASGNRWSTADIAEVSGDISGGRAILASTANSALILSGNNSNLGPPVHKVHMPQGWDPNDPNGMIRDFWHRPNLLIAGGSTESDAFDPNSEAQVGVVYLAHDNAVGDPNGSLVVGDRAGAACVAAYGGPRTINTEYVVLYAKNSIFTGSEDLTLTGNITDFYGSGEYYHLDKTGSGTLTLAGPDSIYNGETRVWEGRLLVDGNVPTQYVWDSPATQLHYHVYDGGTLGGNGFISRILNFYAGSTLQPGHDGIGTLTTRSVVMDPNSTWDYELGALGNNDKIALSGKLYLDGTLNITNVGMPYDPCNPHIVREYVIATYGSDPNNWGDPNDPNNTIMTNLDNRGLDIGTVTVGWRRYSQLLDPEDPNVTPPGEVRVAMVHSHPGDANENGLVNVGDLGILGANYGQCGKDWSFADFTGDGCVNVGDLGVLGFNYGWSEPPPYPPPGGGAVPEPTAVGLVALGGLALIRRRRRH